jgi:hypothetical protein
LKRFPVFVTHHFGSKCRSVRLDGLAKQENLALELFAVCHFVALTGERVASFLASDAAFPCPAPFVFAVPVPTLARLSGRSTSQMICCRLSLSSCSISQSELDIAANVDPEVALRLCPLDLAAVRLPRSIQAVMPPAGGSFRMPQRISDSCSPCRTTSKVGGVRAEQLACARLPDPQDP